MTRLERDGYVRREVDPTDRRKAFTVLTSEGNRVLSEARHTHNDVLRRTFFSATSESEGRILQRVWRRLASQQPERVPTV